MAYNKPLANRIRKKLAGLPNVEEKEMMGGLIFMYNGKMCLGVFGEEMMCRIDPSFQQTAIENTGCHTMDFGNRPMKGYVLIDEPAMKTSREFDYWINVCLAFNSNAKASKKK